MNAFKKLIRESMNRTRLVQKDIARKLRMTQADFSRKLNLERKYSVFEFFDLCTILRIDVKEAYAIYVTSWNRKEMENGTA